MRLDLFLKLTGVAKTRSQAARLVTLGRLLRVPPPPGGRLKPSHEVSVGERYRIERAAGSDALEVLAVPEGQNLPKKDRPLYLKVDKERGEA